MVTATVPQLKTLSLSKKRHLIEELVAEVYGEPVKDEPIASALAARVKHFKNNPESGKSWAEVKARRRGRDCCPQL